MKPRLALLMLTALFGVMNPPGRPPGVKQPAAARMIPCPRPNCRGKGTLESKYRYSCNQHGHTFYYCFIHSFYLTRERAAECWHETEQAAEHRHETDQAAEDRHEAI